MVGVNQFVRRQTADSRFSHYSGTFEEAAELALRHMYQPCMRQGYRDGVLEVDVPPQGFFCPVVTLQPGDRLTGAYEARRQGEVPRKSVGVIGGKKTPAKAVNIILYRYDVLEENKERSTECEWEIVSINARATEEPEPITVGALMANHFGADGGTSTMMDDHRFAVALRKSWEYWQDKAMIAEPVKPQPLPTKPGWYWHRSKTLTDNKWYMVHIVEDGGVLCWDDLTGDVGPMPLPKPGNYNPFEFIGPIEEPT